MNKPYLSYILDENKNPVGVDINTPDGLKAINKFYSDPKNKRVSQDEIIIKGLTYLVSTVFLSVDHNYDDGPPILWETMIFKKGDWSELYCERYSSYKEALEGHLDALKWAKEHL